MMPSKRSLGASSLLLRASNNFALKGVPLNLEGPTQQPVFTLQRRARLNFRHPLGLMVAQFGLCLDLPMYFLFGFVMYFLFGFVLFFGWDEPKKQLHWKAQVSIFERCPALVPRRLFEVLTFPRKLKTQVPRPQRYVKHSPILLNKAQKAIVLNIFGVR